jgi:hypothetical protein
MLISKLPNSYDFVMKTETEIHTMANKFWFLGITAIVKVMRSDYLISSHLALEMVQQCIVLQMILRDRKKGTNIHRIGERESIEILEKMSTLLNSPSPIKILRIIEESSFIFERLYKMINEEHEEKSQILSNWISQALENI